MIKKALPEQEWNNFAHLLLGDSSIEVKLQQLQLIHIDSKRKSDGKTVLLEACEQNNQAAVEFLLANGADVNLADNQGYRPLFITARESLELTQLLVEHGAEINFLPNNKKFDSPLECFKKMNFSPLCMALFSAKDDIFQYLLEQDADPNLKGKNSWLTPLYVAIRSGFEDSARLLLAKGANPNLTANKKQDTFLFMALERFSEPLVAMLLEAGANVGIQTSAKIPALCHLVKLAGERYDDTIVRLFELLIKYKAKINQASDKGYTALYIAITTNNLELARLIIAHGANVNQMITTLDGIQGNLLHCIASLELSNEQQLAELLLANKIDVEQRESIGGLKPIHFACRFNKPRLVKSLLQYDAEIDALDYSKHTPLMHAVMENNVKVVKELLNRPKHRKPKLDWVAGEVVDYQAIHLAAFKGCLAIVKLLIQNGVDVNATTRFEEVTPLLIASLQGYTKLVEYLLEQKADPRIRRWDNTSCLAAAFANGHMDIVKLLLASEYFSEILKGTGLDRATLVKILIKIYPEFIGLEEEFAHKEVSTTNLQQADATVLQTKPQPVAPKVTQNHYTLFAQPAESSQIASYVEVMPKTQNYHSFLVEQGFTKQKIKELREQAKQQSKESRPIASRPKTAVVSSTSWCNGLLDTDMAKIKPIGGQDTKSPNCFLYLDSQSLQEQGCKQLALFENLSLKFCAEQNEQGLKSLKGNLLNIRAVIGDKIDNYALTHEIKIKGNASRILCFPLLSDDSRSTLYIGAVFAKQGLHDKHVTKKYKLDSKVIVIDLPEQPKLEQARSLRLN